MDSKYKPRSLDDPDEDYKGPIERKNSREDRQGVRENPPGRLDDDYRKYKPHPKTPAEDVLTNKDLFRYITKLGSGRKAKDWYDGDLAAKLGYLELMKMSRNLEFSERAIDFAAENGNLLMVEYLLENGVMCTDNAMDCAAAGGHLDMLKFLHSLDYDIVCTEAATTRAAENGHLQILSWLYDNNYRYCTVDAFENAAKNGHLEVLQFLAEKYYDLRDAPTGKYKNFFKKLYAAAGQTGNLVLFQWLMDTCGRIDKYEHEAFFSAARAGKTNILEYCYELDIKPFEENTHAVNNAISGGHLALLQDFCQRGAEVHESNFVTAINHNQFAIAQWLHFEKGLGLVQDDEAELGILDHDFIRWLVEDLHYQLNLDNTHALMVNALNTNSFATVQWLVEQRDFPRFDDKSCQAVTTGNILILEYLLQHKILSEKHSDQWVSEAMKAKKPDMATWLIMKGYPLGSVEMAAATNDLDFLKKVLKNGGEITSIKPLLNAISQNNFDMVKFLAEKGIIEKFPEDFQNIFSKKFMEYPKPLAMVKWLYHKGAKVTKKCFKEIAYGNLTAAKFLLDQYRRQNSSHSIRSGVAGGGFIGNDLSVVKFMFKNFKMEPPTNQTLLAVMFTTKIAILDWIWNKVQPDAMFIQMMTNMVKNMQQIFIEKLIHEKIPGIASAEVNEEEEHPHGRQDDSFSEGSSEDDY